MAWWLIVLIAYFGLNLIIALLASMVALKMYWSRGRIIGLFFKLLFVGLLVIIAGIFSGERVI